MIRKNFTIMLVVLSLCSIMCLCYADDGNWDEIEKIKKELDNREDLTEKFKDHYNKIHGQVKDLISAYDAKDSSEYLQAMETAVTALDRAYANMNAAYYGGTYHGYAGDTAKKDFVYDSSLEFSKTTDGYVGEWERYLDALTKHRIVRTTTTPVSKTPFTKEQIRYQLDRHKRTNWHHAGAVTVSGGHTLELKYVISGAKGAPQNILAYRGTVESKEGFIMKRKMIWGLVTLIVVLIIGVSAFMLLRHTDTERIKEEI